MIYEVKILEGFKNNNIVIPGSKSITNRALILASLSNEISKIKNILISDDTEYMLKSLEKMGFGVHISADKSEVKIDKKNVAKIKGEYFVGNAGTAMRFLPSLVGAIGGEAIFTGIERMKNRPIKELVDALKIFGVEIAYMEKEGFPPIKIISYGLIGGEVEIDGKVSSQFISSILMASPLAKKDVKINVKDLISKPYVMITLNMMKEFGVDVTFDEKMATFYIKFGQKYNGIEYYVEPDCSAASYFFASAAIVKGDITINNLNENCLQGDIRFIDVLEKMGAKVYRNKDNIRIVGNVLKGIEVDMNDIPDTAQTLAVTALFAEGPTTIKNVKSMRVKETDRISALCNELRKLGAKVDEYDDGLKIYPSKIYNGAYIKTYDDHRMAMSFALAGLKIEGVKIEDAECVSKTFPNYFDEFEKLY